MIKLRHARTGGDLWVHESRLDEYLAAGHTLAAYVPPESPKEVKKPAQKKAPAKKTAPKATAEKTAPAEEKENDEK